MSAQISALRLFRGILADAETSAGALVRPSISAGSTPLTGTRAGRVIPAPIAATRAPQGVPTPGVVAIGSLSPTKAKAAAVLLPPATALRTASHMHITTDRARVQSLTMEDIIARVPELPDYDIEQIISTGAAVMMDRHYAQYGTPVISFGHSGASA